MTQPEQVIKAMRDNGGFATLRRLNELIDFSTWGTKTPEASVRRIVQVYDAFFKIQPGLWALEECREDVLKLFQIKTGNPKSEEQFNHSYYQGLLIEIGKLMHYITYIPAQDKNRMYLDKPLNDVSDLVQLPDFTNNKLIQSKARTIDVIWFNSSRHMPAAFYEVEHSTDIKNSLSKFYELQDFNAKFRIVASENRENEYNDKINASIFDEIRDRVKFLSYSKVAKFHATLNEAKPFLNNF